MVPFYGSRCARIAPPGQIATGLVGTRDEGKMPFLMRIGPHLLKNRLIVAPMAGVTDRPFRQLCKRLGAGMAVSVMVTANSLLYGSAKTARRANHDGEVAPISVQIEIGRAEEHTSELQS